MGSLIPIRSVNVPARVWFMMEYGPSCNGGVPGVPRREKIAWTRAPELTVSCPPFLYPCVGTLREGFVSLPRIPRWRGCEEECQRKRIVKQLCASQNVRD